MLRKTSFGLLLWCLPLPAQPVTVVVLGASTAAGKNLTENGESAADSWVNRYSAYLSSQRPGSRVINLAVSGYNTYHGLPTGSAVPAGRPAPDTAKNITAALARRPDAIIANYVGWGAFGPDEAFANLLAISDAASHAGIPIWIGTPQPNLIATDSAIALALALCDRIASRFGNRALDFWTPLADTDGSGRGARELIQLYDDNHPNAEGHRRLFEQVKAAGLFGTPAALAREPAEAARPFPARVPYASPLFPWKDGRFTLSGRIP